jgi:hypothetical protein
VFVIGVKFYSTKFFCLGEEPFLLFANRHDLREIRLYSGNYHLLVDGLKSVIALDFDFSEKLLFWSDVATETISMYENRVFRT